MDRVTMENRVLDATLRGDDGSTNGNRIQIRNDLLDAITEVDAQLRPQIVKVVKTLTAGQQDYSLASDFLLTGVGSIRDIVYLSPNNPDISQPLEPMSPEYIRELRRTFTYSTYIAAWAMDGLDLLLLYPATQTVGDSITIYYSPIPIDLVNPTDVPTGLPPQFHDIYVVAAIMRAIRQTSPEYTAQYMQMMDKRMNDFRKWRNRRAGAIPRRAVVGRPGRRLVPHNNSADWRY